MCSVVFPRATRSGMPVPAPSKWGTWCQKLHWWLGGPTMPGVLHGTCYREKGTPSGPITNFRHMSTSSLRLCNEFLPLHVCLCTPSTTDKDIEWTLNTYIKNHTHVKQTTPPPKKKRRMRYSTHVNLSQMLGPHVQHFAICTPPNPKRAQNEPSCSFSQTSLYWGLSKPRNKHRMFHIPQVKPKQISWTHVNLSQMLARSSCPSSCHLALDPPKPQKGQTHKNTSAWTSGHPVTSRWVGMQHLASDLCTSL